MAALRSDRPVFLRVLLPLIVATLTLGVVCVAGFQALSAARAYVGGESHWSKARSRAVAFLRTAPTQDCGKIDTLLDVPLGDRDARTALDTTPPDHEAAVAGFRRGGLDADDIEPMIRLYRYAGHLPAMREAITAWERGDVLIDQLRRLGMRICAQARADASPAALAPLMRELDQLDEALIAAETEYSRALGRASRWTGSVLTAATVALALALLVGGAAYLVVSLRARFAQQRDLEDVNNRWELAAAAANVGVFSWQPATDTLDLDARARSMYGVPTDTTVPVKRDEILDRVHPDDRAALEALARVDQGGSDRFTRRYRVLQADGSQRHLEASGVLRHAEDPARARMFGIVRDIGDEVAHARMQLEKEAAERSARARTEFLSRLSHELRTPLNAILGLAQVIEMDPGEPLQPRQAQRLKLLLESGWHLLHLVDDVLDITSIDAGQVAVTTGPTDLRQVVEASLRLVEPERQAFDVQVRNRMPAQVPPVLADGRRLQQVLVNLFSNACKYNRRGGALTLACRALPDAICLDVQDEGEGLRPQDIAELFQPFKRVRPVAEVPGTGLGLTVVKLLVGQMGGSIDVASEPGAGSVFTVRLKRAG